VRATHLSVTGDAGSRRVGSQLALALEGYPHRSQLCADLTELMLEILRHPAPSLLPRSDGG
jgi:hypothetical protein